MAIVNSSEARNRAEASFVKREQQARDADKARAEYQLASRAVEDKTARLRALRLAKEEADRAAVVTAPVAPGKKRKTPRPAR
jgi:hypothetical protein